MLIDHYGGDLGPVLKQISDMLDSGLDNKLRSKSMTSSQARVLMTLDFADGGSMTQRDLEDILMVSHPTIVGLMRRLQAKGLIVVSDREGNRSKTVSLTDAGRAVADDVRGDIRRMEETLVRGIGEEDMERLRVLLSRMHGNLAEHRGSRQCSDARPRSC